MAEGREMSIHPADAVLQTMTRRFGRLGKAHGAGFYEYPQDGPKFLWPQLQAQFRQADRKLSPSELIERLMFVQALEAVRCFEEGVVTSVAAANIGSIFGWGFAPFKGGTLQYIDDYGAPAFVDRARQLAERYGERFDPPAALLQLAKKGHW